MKTKARVLAACLEAITAGRRPTVHEVRAAVGLRSHSLTHRYIQQLRWERLLPEDFCRRTTPLAPSAELFERPKVDHRTVCGRTALGIRNALRRIRLGKVEEAKAILETILADLPEVA